MHTTMTVQEKPVEKWLDNWELCGKIINMCVSVAYYNFVNPWRGLTLLWCTLKDCSTSLLIHIAKRVEFY